MIALEPRTLFAGRFEIERMAGSGGMGAVYCARDLHTEDRVAIKLMHGDAAGAVNAERFIREARLLAELRHPGIVAHVAHGQAADGRRWLAMEWLDGEDLAQRLARGPLAIADAVRLVRRASEALQVAHGVGVVHRDLKPSNLFLVGGRTDQVKLLDFGVARRGAASQAMTGTGLIVGTPEYMAPEQARGEADVRSDVYALGAVI